MSEERLDMQDVVESQESAERAIQRLNAERRTLRKENRRLKVGIVKLIHAGTLSIGQAVAIGLTMEQLYEINKQFVKKAALQPERGEG